MYELRSNKEVYKKMTLSHPDSEQALIALQYLISHHIIINQPFNPPTSLPSSIITY